MVFIVDLKVLTGEDKTDMHNLANATHPTWAPLWQKTLWSLFLVVWCGMLGATAAWAVTDFVVLGHEGIWVRQGSTVVSGDVGANVASVGPFLAGDQEVTIGKNVVVQDPTSRVLGDTEIILPCQVEVGDDVKINSIFPEARNSFHGLPTLRLSNVLDETLQLAVWPWL
jgi:hypothetical protein